MLKSYYYLTKPGIIYGNALTAAAGFFLAAKGHPHWGLLIAMLVGLSLIIASACVYNNYIDRPIDALMARTKRRATVTGSISGPAALIYATVLAILGTLVLFLGTNYRALGTALAGLFLYVVVYGFAKRRSIYGTEVGSIAGAVPPVVGYVAYTNHFDLGAYLLFLILALWQMPHFYAIAVFRLPDYQAAKLPVLPVVRGIPATKIRMVAYIVAFIFAAVGLFAFGYAGYFYLAATLIVGLFWLNLALRGFRATDSTQWARRVFFFSLIVLSTLSAMMTLNPST